MPLAPAKIESKTLNADEFARCDQLQSWSHRAGLERISVSHGDIIEDNPAFVLRDLAHQLAA